MECRPHRSGTNLGFARESDDTATRSGASLTKKGSKREAEKVSFGGFFQVDFILQLMATAFQASASALRYFATNSSSGGVLG